MRQRNGTAANPLIKKTEKQKKEEGEQRENQRMIPETFAEFAPEQKLT